MKKFLFLLLVTIGISACTTPEEDMQIKLFWMEQMMQLMPKSAHPAPMAPQPFPVFPNDETFPPAFPAEEEQSPLPDEVVAQPATTLEKQPAAVPAEQTTVSVSQAPKGITPKPQVTARHTQTQFMEITLEDNPRVNRFKSNAPLKERQAMQRAIENVKQANQQALQDIGLMFGGDTQAQAFAIVAKSEKILMRTANTSNTYQNYLNAQRKILQEQDAQLNQLMRQNAYKLRRVRG